MISLMLPRRHHEKRRTYHNANGLVERWHKLPGLPSKAQKLASKLEWEEREEKNILVLQAWYKRQRAEKTAAAKAEAARAAQILSSPEAQEAHHNQMLAALFGA